MTEIKPNQILPIQNEKNIGLDDLLSVCILHEERVVVTELIRRRDNGEKVVTMHPAGIALLDRLNERLRSSQSKILS